MTTERTTMFTAPTREEIERKIDKFLDEGKAFEDLPLIIPVGGVSRTAYRGISVREWWHEGNVRYDSAVKLII